MSLTSAKDLRLQLPVDFVRYTGEISAAHMCLVRALRRRKPASGDQQYILRLDMLFDLAFNYPAMELGLSRSHFMLGS